MRAIDLTAKQRSVIADVIAPLASRFERIAVYGSRAEGRARPGSDIDLVVFGARSDDDVAILREGLENSDLSIFADVIAYERISHGGLRKEIDQYALTFEERFVAPKRSPVAPG